MSTIFQTLYDCILIANAMLREMQGDCLCSLPAFLIIFRIYCEGGTNES